MTAKLKRETQMENRMNESHTSTSRSTERSTAVVVSAEIADQYANQPVSTLHYTDTHTTLTALILRRFKWIVDMKKR